MVLANPKLANPKRKESQRTFLGGLSIDSGKSARGG
jgi:hypothetical protein